LTFLFRFALSLELRKPLSAGNRRPWRSPLERSGPWPQDWPAAVWAAGDVFARPIAEPAHRSHLDDGLLIRAPYGRRPEPIESAR